MFLEVPGRHTAKDGGSSGRLCRAVGRPNAVLVQPGHATVTHQHHPVDEGPGRLPHVDLWRAVASPLRRVNLVGQGSQVLLPELGTVDVIELVLFGLPVLHNRPLLSGGEALRLLPPHPTVSSSQHFEGIVLWGRESLTRGH